MAEIKTIDMQNGGIEIKLSISKSEYNNLKNHTKDILILPRGEDSLTYELTTGKLGNSNRIMVPKKMLEAFKVHEMEKKAHSNIFIVDGDAFLLAKIRKSEIGIPKFRE